MYTENANLIKYIEQVEAENALLKGFMASLIIEAHRDHYGDAAAAYSDIKDIIQEAEKIMGDKARECQPVKHGRWITHNCGDFVCSVCGWEFSDELPYMAREYNAETEEIMGYCMHCGAKMDGDAE